MNTKRRQRLRLAHDVGVINDNVARGVIGYARRNLKKDRDANHGLEYLSHV